ncbi:MAG: aminotransferase class I/II-fold pyridoxal phosphate-dependent enzyme [Candidatus Peregrinibacteria bacterium]
MKIIHHTFGPHITTGYVGRSLKLLLQPWKWKRGTETELLRSELSGHFGMDVIFFSCGRQGLLALLKAFEAEKGSEIIIQAYTCVVVPNAIEAAGLVPVYADVDIETLNLDCSDVERKITHKTKAILCQHSFGIPADTRTLRALCDRYNLFLIEDCAHIIPDASGPEEIGKDGDFILLSFGRDKAISGIDGGAMLSRDSRITQQLIALEGSATDMKGQRIARLLLYPLLYWICRPLYGMGIGKDLLWLARRISLLVPILTSGEKNGIMSAKLQRIPNACAALALTELRNLKAINDHRRELTNFYFEALQKNSIPVPKGITPDLPLLKFPLFVKNANGIRAALKQKNIHLNDGWTGCVVCPADSNLSAAGYVPGSDPQAEAACQMILSLPTHPTMTLDQAQILTEALLLQLSK